MNGHAVDLREPRSQLVGERLDAQPNRVNTEIQRIVDGRSQAKFGGDVALPILEAPRVAAYLELFRRLQHRGMQIERSGNADSSCRHKSFSMQRNPMR